MQRFTLPSLPHHSGITLALDSLLTEAIPKVIRE